MNSINGFPSVPVVTPVGSLAMWGASTAPTGWLLCDGTAVSRSKYSRLFKLIGTTFGAGDGASTFGLPDFRSRSPIGAGTGTGLTVRTLAGTGGAETHALALTEIPSHTHTGWWTAGSASLYYGTGDLDGVYNSGYTGYTGSGTAHANMHPWTAINFIIRAEE